MIALTAALLLAFVPAAPQRDERVFQPCEYSSITGDYTLRVEPSQRDGSGSMHCRVRHGKDELWSADFPWTFETAGVASDGTAVGYRNGEELRIAVIDPKGALLKEHRIEHSAWIVDGPALPMASGDVLVHSKAGVALIRVHPADQSRPSPWKSIRLADGALADDVLPTYPIALAEGQSLYERGAKVIGETGLTLCHWWTLDFRRDDIAWAKDGCVFSLNDLHGQTVWRLPLLDDYTDRTSKEASERLSNSMERKEVILSTGPGNRFAVWEVKAKQRVEFDVQKDGDSGWRVVEVGRTPYPPETPQAAPVESIQLKLLGRTPLLAKTEKTLEPIHDVCELGFTSSGEIEIFRQGRTGSLSYARLTPAGVLVFERDLGPLLPAGADRPDLFKLTGDRWLFQFGEQKPPWIEVDVKTGTTKACPLPDAGISVSIAPQADGSYLAVLPEMDGAAVVTELVYVKPDGSFGWRERVCGVAPDDSDFQKAVSSAEGVASVGDAHFVILDMNELVTIDLEKRVLSSRKIEDLIGHEPIYANDLRSDGKGGVCFEEGDRIWRVDAHGSLAGSLAPRLSDGSEGKRLESMVRFAPDGRAWTSDGRRIYRLDDRGVADLVLGPAPKADKLQEPEEELIDSFGRVLVLDSGSGSVHVFDSEGKRLFVCTPESAERSGTPEWHSLHVSRDGTIHLAVKDGVASFDAHGQRLRTQATEVAGSADNRRNRSTDDTWEELDRLDPALQALLAIDRRPDGNWLEHAVCRALAPDGTRILLEMSREEAAGPQLLFYSSKNEPLGAVSIGPNKSWCRMSVTSRWVMAGGYGPSWALVRMLDRKVFRFEAGGQDRGEQIAGQTSDGRVLLVLDLKTLELLRYELP